MKSFICDVWVVVPQRNWSKQDTTSLTQSMGHRLPMGRRSSETGQVSIDPTHDWWTPPLPNHIVCHSVYYDEPVYQQLANRHDSQFPALPQPRHKNCLTIILPLCAIAHMLHMTSYKQLPIKTKFISSLSSLYWCWSWSVFNWKISIYAACMINDMLKMVNFHFFSGILKFHLGHSKLATNFFWIQLHFLVARSSVNY